MMARAGHQNDAVDAGRSRYERSDCSSREARQRVRGEDRDRLHADDEDRADDGRHDLRDEPRARRARSVRNRPTVSATASAEAASPIATTTP